MAIWWHSSDTWHGALTRPSYVLPEPAFLRALSLERKRAERSQRPFVLMLIARGTATKLDDAELLDRAASLLAASIRATDIAGWHAHNRVLGLIFSELGTVDKESVLSALSQRITTALQSSFGPDQGRRLNIALYYFPDDPIGGGQEGLPLAPLYPDLIMRAKTTRVSRALKRALDIVGSLGALVALSPLLLAIAVVIKASSPGPALFRQQRIGRHGVPFTFLKFRSMHASNDPQQHRAFVTEFIGGNTPSSAATANGQVVYKLTRDPRVTLVGRFLRRTSLDELPQLLNVLRGDMSLVGPRPPIPYELEAYQPWHRRRFLDAPPGITGLWQVNGRSQLRFDDMVRLDLRYATTWSLWLDIKILLQTPRAVFSGKGAH
jgi:lipopolysaccharide/colanic/teichoic acid biosynthesis glycosyltransferase